ncbi:MAG: aminotransferase class III-fold pyridoxal phosphate-dependent enzyme, partial [Clostridiales bacterium]|nr:aminotransferase class III-fold pyridoxal phosphate-dependent enzyme [Clostridiales bacterium]
MFNKVSASLCDLIGKDYVNAVLDARAALGEDISEASAAANEVIDFFPESAQNKDNDMLSIVGKQIVKPFVNSVDGAGTGSFQKALHKNSAPVTGIGSYRIGEDGKVYLIGKSEHYHTPMGHRFSGYKLIDNARKVGIVNATHNNTRGYITRLCEQELIKAVNKGNIASDKSLSSVINLETGSLAVEAGIKMMLTRFYRLDSSFDAPVYSGRIPVFFVMADSIGGKTANYHGTTVVAQTFRGMWPELYESIESNELYKVVSIKINDIEDFKSKMKRYNTGKYKTAGFLHEIILMNYGGIRLTPEFLRSAYELCEQYDTPELVDEIQSCMWYKGMFLFKLYGLKPDFVVVGKGFPGGEYPASKILISQRMDSLNQFGALVTNGQEELASLSYLITMRFMEENGEYVESLANDFHNKLTSVGKNYPALVSKVEGEGHLVCVHFYNLDQAKTFAKALNSECIDASAQVYKAECPPAVLLKPPVIASGKVLSYICERIDATLA